jgi:hypothetical protein
MTTTGGSSKVAGIAGVVFGLAAVPNLHFMVVDLEGKADAANYLAHVDDRYLRIALFGSGGLVLAAVLLVHLLAIRSFAVESDRGGLFADAATAIAAAGPIGIFLSSCAAIMAAYGAHEGYTFESVRPMGLLAENLFTASLSLLVGSAALVASLALRAGVLRRWLGWVAGGFTVLLGAITLLLPPVGGLVATAWVLVAGIGFLLAPARARAQTNLVATAAAREA